jgi:hypothetical protein
VKLRGTALECHNSWCKKFGVAKFLPVGQEVPQNFNCPECLEFTLPRKVWEEEEES